ncbi:MAG: hypothetical protein UX85_C0004G0026 [Candidatus Beckwithbacteria bacterium GW2011_GWB1_47_15]|uniref:Uncharacterized protein n=1 Tax=Candidatus Beckwithbacteria bacterium GW2011_GWB1_47_15 TaxID=1618371 RepID=A0A0G1UTS7_9BACT|nr:MAG: hypothetical protein UY43_C0001G0223 [Candidatus Beckwithbacteria bacterium GW2011_GWC1_49_16]KKU35430.1 MAG: hypothetical protein UX50_C0003G0026 [Candidatus Beckwithbacteria bacterium GW2011_GWA1_46_30]KKU61105.1 MAG: hypothetical protein UX85_C0004G0026 [Candidatus Beckwithbacteria bacterium GW2011_GWB1_47_15]KKU71944.1 MAG: hypothetical protein UX97_C0002G0026 [Candidatus Beckwithbacteria bacterium GW2011_GWA2_47_25]KKW03181.1 MAG: hypothetical protein UY37_C0006G0005 [Candidatus Be
MSTVTAFPTLPIILTPPRAIKLNLKAIFRNRAAQLVVEFTALISLLTALATLSWALSLPY